MIVRKLSLRTLPSLALVVMLAGSACGSGGSTEAAYGNPASTEASEMASSDIPEALASSDGESLPGLQTATADGSPSCIVGEWMMTDDALSSFYNAVSAAAAEDFAEIALGFEISGEAQIDFFDDGTFAYRPDLDLGLNGGQGGTDLISDGTTTGALFGTYGVVDSVLATTITDDQMEVVITMGGEEYNTAELGTDLESVMPFSNTPIDCSGSNPVLMLEVSTATGEIFPLELTPR